MTVRRAQKACTLSIVQAFEFRMRGLTLIQFSTPLGLETDQQFNGSSAGKRGVRFIFPRDLSIYSCGQAAMINSASAL